MSDMPNLWVDTNFARSARALSSLSRLARSKGFRVVIPMPVYVEDQHHERVYRGSAFSLRRYDEFLDQAGISLLSFDKDQATRVASKLAEWFPTDDAWQSAKRIAIGREGRGRAPMTTDWLIAAFVAADADARVVTGDSGHEWSKLRDAERVLSHDEAIGWLSSQPDARA